MCPPVNASPRRSHCTQRSRIMKFRLSLCSSPDIRQPTASAPASCGSIEFMRKIPGPVSPDSLISEGFPTGDEINVSKKPSDTEILVDRAGAVTTRPGRSCWCASRTGCCGWWPCARTGAASLNLGSPGPDPWVPNELLVHDRTSSQDPGENPQDPGENRQNWTKVRGTYQCQVDRALAFSLTLTECRYNVSDKSPE